MKKILKYTLSFIAAAAMITSSFCSYAGNDATEKNTGLTGVADNIERGGTQGAGYSTILYDSSNGLPTSEANAVIQASDGFVWIGSYSGLIRYDGNDFERFDASSGISSVVCLYEDSKGRIWIGTNDSGVAFYEKGKFTLYDQIEGLKSSTIRSVSEDAQGNIVIATTLGIAYVDTNGELHLLDDAQLNTQSIDQLQCDDNGVIYGVTNHGAFFTIENMKVTSYYSGEMFSSGSVYCICPDGPAEGTVFLGTSTNDIITANLADGGIDFSVTDVSPLERINKIADISDKLWICADNGIGYIDADNNFVKLENLPMNNSIDDIMYDYEGNLWFASSRQGLMKISESDFIDVNTAAGLGSMVINSTCVHGDKLYIGTDSGLYALKTGSFSRINDDLSGLLGDVRIRCIKEDSRGNMWVCTYGGHGLVCLKNDGSITEYNSSSGLDCQKVRVCEELSDGRMAVSADTGIFIIKDGQVTEHITAANGLSDADTLTICEGSDGTIYLGSDGDGLYKLKNNSLTRLNKKDGLRSEVILRMKYDASDDTYWIITSNSIAYMKDDVITTVRNFPYSNNFDIFFDGQGGAWILSSNGIYITTTAQLKNDSDIKYIFYDTSCGLPSVATANSRSCLTENGDLYISGNAGVSLININSLRTENSDIILSIPFIEVDDEILSVKQGTVLNVPSHTKRITIYAYALTFSLKNPRLSYRLTGFDDTETDSLRSEMKPASYTNLSGGTYRFELSVLNTLTGNKDQTVYITINKELAFYEQFWFKIVIIVAAALLMFFIFDIIRRSREAALIKEKEKKQIMLDEVISAFAKCVDMKDEYTNGHSFRVAEYSRLIAEKIGKNEDELKQIYNTALLHDIGKISIPDSVLHKPGKPTDEEYAILKTHAANGYEILKQINIAPELAYGAGCHHERLDGKGYPRGLKGDEIPEVAQIIAVADTFDAMYSTRPYRKQMDVNDVLTEMKRVSGTQLNERYVNYLIELVHEGKIGQREL